MTNETDKCKERVFVDGKHEWMPYRWVKESSPHGGYGNSNTVMKLGEVICKYCLQKKDV